MPTLSLLRFTDTNLGQAALPVLGEAQRSRTITLEDAALISWPAGSVRPETRQLLELDLRHPLSRGFWQFLVGSALLVPVAAKTLGQAVPDGCCSLDALGIDDAFVRGLRTRLVGGTSGLFLLTADATADRVVKALAELEFSLFSTNLTRQQMGALLTAFGASSASQTGMTGTEATESERSGSSSFERAQPTCRR